MTVGTDLLAALADTAPQTVATPWGPVTIGAATVDPDGAGGELICVWPGPAAGEPTWRLTGLNDPGDRGGLAVVADAIGARAGGRRRR